MNVRQLRAELEELEENGYGDLRVEMEGAFGLYFVQAVILQQDTVELS